MKFSEIINDQQLATEAIRRWITVAICIVISVVVADWIAYPAVLYTCPSGRCGGAGLRDVGMQRSAWILILVGWQLQARSTRFPCR